MKLHFYGAARQVTGSKHLVTTEKGTRVLLDCGLFQGLNTDELNQNFGFDPATVDVLVLSHAHIDHSGLIPRLVAQGFRGPIYCTPATKDLCDLLLGDSARIQETDLERVNRRRKKRGQELLETLYTAADVDRALDLFQSVNYHEDRQIAPDVRLLFTDTGHILGSAAVSLTIQEAGSEKRLFFSGDIGRPHDKILRMPEAFPQADFIICESTYGDRLHPMEADVKAGLVKLVRETCVENGGKIIIPAFSVDRTQELVYALDQLSNEGLLPRLPVYVDSPLSVRATRVMSQHPECFNPEILKYTSHDGNPFDFPNLHYVSDVAESKAINASREPSIIISASGMAEAGRIKHHIKNNVEDARNTILLVGYASPSSLGGALKRGDREVTIFGDRFQVNARVAVMDSFSAHGDYAEMMQFLDCQDKKKVQCVFLVHGDYDVQESFRERLLGAGWLTVDIPSQGDEFDL